MFSPVIATALRVVRIAVHSASWSEINADLGASRIVVIFPAP
jgi:hypothetical protein